MRIRGYKKGGGVIIKQERLKKTFTGDAATILVAEEEARKGDNKTTEAEGDLGLRQQREERKSRSKTPAADASGPHSGRRFGEPEERWVPLPATPP